MNKLTLPQLTCGECGTTIEENHNRDSGQSQYIHISVDFDTIDDGHEAKPMRVEAQEQA